VTGKGIKNLSASRSKSLKTAFLDFSLSVSRQFSQAYFVSCGQINDVSANILIQSLQGLSYLQNIGLNFMW